MTILRCSIFLTFALLSQNISALTISILESSASSVIYSKVLEEIYKRADIPLEFVVMPTQRSLAQSTKGLIDGELVRIHKVGDLYPTLIRVPTPFIFFESTAFSNKPNVRHNIQRDGWKALIDYRVGMVRGMKHAEIGLKDIDDVVDVNRTKQLFDMLDRSRIDIAVTSKISGLYFIKELGLPALYPLEPALQKHDLYHYLHEKNEQYVPILDATIRSMKESGELAKLRDKFIKELLE